MSDMPDPLAPLGGPDEDDPEVSRRRALWVLVVLACLALIVGCLMVLLGGGSGPEQHQVDLLPPVQTPVSNPNRAPTTGPGGPSTAGAPSTSGASTSAASTTAPSTVAPTGPARTGNPCASGNACLVDGDGGALAAVNAYRTEHGLDPVPGGVTRKAQLCAQTKGSGTTCVPHYAWTTVSEQDGAKAVAKIADFGRDWLLDASTETIGVGWAYVNGQYECALLKAP